MKALTSEQLRFFERAASQYQTDLSSDTYAQDFLVRRGIDRETAVGFRLGSVRNPLPGDELFRGRLAIPYVTTGGICNFKFRCIENHDCGQQGEQHKRYRNHENLNTNLFNVNSIDTDEPFLCIAEGEIDAITLSMCGLPAIGVPGVANWKDHFNLLLEDFGELYLFADGDDAGYKLGKFLAKEVRVTVIKMPPREDVNSIYLSKGAAGIHDLLIKARGNG